MRKVAAAFLESYAATGSRETLARAKSPKYYRPFQPFVVPGMAHMLRNLMEEYT